MFANFIQMPPRKLQATANIGPSQRNILRDYFSIATRGVGSRPSQEVLRGLRARYNIEIGNLQGFQANQRRIQRQRNLRVIPIANWVAFVDTLIPDTPANAFGQVGLRQRPFTLIIESATIRGVVRELRFNNYYQFVNWYNLIMDETIISNSDNITTFRTWTMEDRSIFDNSILSVNFIQGGCNICQSTGVRILNKTIVGEFNSFNVYNPPVKNNNCGISCIAYTLGIELSALNIRREFNLESNTEIPMEVMKLIYNKYNRGKKFIAIISRNFSNKLNFELCDYILHEVLPNGKGHFLVVESINETEIEKNQKFRRSLLAFDFETRNQDKSINFVKCGKSVKYNMIDTICSLEYRTLGRKNYPIETKN
jgi:hypothetical protein